MENHWTGRESKPLTDTIQILLHRLINTFTIQFPASRHS